MTRRQHLFEGERMFVQYLTENQHHFATRRSLMTHLIHRIIDPQTSPPGTFCSVAWRTQIRLQKEPDPLTGESTDKKNSIDTRRVRFRRSSLKHTWYQTFIGFFHHLYTQRLQGSFVRSPYGFYYCVPSGPSGCRMQRGKPSCQKPTVPGS